MTVLVILESGAKCGTVSKILGGDVKCIATGGHIREVDGGLAALSSNYIPQYKPKSRLILSRLRAAVAGADRVLLAMDDDREGEAIAWHCCQCLKLPLTTRRMVFHAVTPECVSKAYANTRPLAMNLVHAQIARVAADLLVGFTVSPKLWRAIGGRGNLSAGRCQTPALGLAIDAADTGNEMVVEHKVHGTFGGIPTDFVVRPDFADTSDVVSFFKASPEHDHVLAVADACQSAIQPPKPFTTSALQQAASAQLGWSPKKTMTEAGKLYSDGHITYPRTDKAEYSPDFTSKARAYIQEGYGDAYLQVSSTKKSKTKHAQEAHEAIRVTRLDRATISDGSALYKLIWRNTLQSCMNAWTRMVTSLRITAPCSRVYVASLVETKHLGWKIVEDKHHEMLQQELGMRAAIDTVEREVQTLEHAQSRISASGGPQLLKEASLVKALERTGIGRPSTYASLVDKLLERAYVRKGDTDGMEVETREYTYTPSGTTSAPITKVVGSQKQRLIPTDLGRQVYAKCMALHESLFSKSYTAQLEAQLDAIASGSETREVVCKALAEELSSSELEEAPKGHRAGFSYCVGKYGPCLREDLEDGKVRFHKLQPNTTKAMVDAASDPSTFACVDVKVGMHTGLPVVMKTGKYGKYIECGRLKASWDGVAAPDLSTAVTLLDERASNSGPLRVLDAHWKILKGVKGRSDYAQKSSTSKGRKKPVRQSLARYPGDHLSDPVATVLEWINNAYNV